MGAVTVGGGWDEGKVDVGDTVRVASIVGDTVRVVSVLGGAALSRNRRRGAASGSSRCLRMFVSGSVRWFRIGEARGRSLITASPRE